jgi:hypothetical protein
MINFKTGLGSARKENPEQKEDQTMKKRNALNDLFNQSWEFFVVKFDKETGKFVGKLACCAHTPV